MTEPAKPAAGKPGKALQPIEEVRGVLMGPTMGAELQKALPEHISVAKFQRVAVTAINQNPELLQADRTSLYGACMKAAQDGLLPDGREAALVIFNRKRGDSWEKLVQYMPMVAGVLKKIRNSGELKELSSHVVYQEDYFDYNIDDTGEHLTHRPFLDGPRGDFRLVYAIATTKDGGRYIEVMTKEHVDQVREVSKAKNVGPWVDWYPEMARKTVIRRLSKRLPMSTDIDDLLHRDDDLYDLNGPKDMGAALVAPAEDKRPRRLQSVVDAPAPKDIAPQPQPEPAPTPAPVATPTPTPASAPTPDASTEVI